MSKLWYPVIDYEKCEECGACSDKCSHGVYDKTKAPTPVVIYTEGCVEGCHGCGKLCPSGAICYVGENMKKSNDCGCSCNCSDEKCC